MVKCLFKTLTIIPLLYSIVSVSAETPFCKNTAYDWLKDAKITSKGNEGYSSYSKRVSRASCRKPWTILIYMAADNDLTPYALWDIHDMERKPKLKSQQVGSTDRLDVLVQLDTSQSDEVRRLHLFQSTKAQETKGLEFFNQSKETQILSPIVALAKDTNRSTDSAKLKGFLEWGIKNYPSQNVMVIVWGHGQGWTAKHLKKNPGEAFSSRGFGGLAFDEAQKSYLSIPDLSKVLRSVSTQLRRPIDVYASDACLMQMTEVAYEVASSTRFIVGSTQVQSYLGLPYTEVLSEINASRFFGEKKLVGGDSAKDEAYLVARMIPKIIKKSMDPKNGSQGKYDPDAIKTLTSSSISSSELQNYLVPSLMKLGQSISKYLSEKVTRKSTLQFSIQDTPAFLGGAQDLKVFLSILDQQLLEEATSAGGSSGIRRYTVAAKTLSAAIYETNQAINRTVLSYAIGTSYAIDEFENTYGVAPTGLSIWLPTSSEDYQGRVADFSKSRFYKTLLNGRSPWRAWLTNLY